jgi:hypothetical protein
LGEVPEQNLLEGPPLFKPQPGKFQQSVDWGRLYTTYGKEAFNIAEATETPEVILALALAESREDRADPLFVNEEGEEGAYTLSLFSFYGELPIAEGMGETILDAAKELVESIKRTTNLLEGS